MRRGSKKNRLLDYWLGIPLLNLLACFHRKRSKPPQIVRIGVICSPALGDALLCSGPLGDLRRHFGEGVKIIHFTMRANEAAAELIPYPTRRVLINLTNPTETIRALRNERLDLLIDFSAWQRLTAFYTLVSRANFTVGFRTAGMYRSRGYDLTALHRNDRHEVENFRDLLRELPIRAGLPPKVQVPQGIEAFANELDLVVFHPWASGQKSFLREWPDERWLALAERLRQEKTLFVITCGPAELARTEGLVAKMWERGLRAEPFAGTDGFKTLARMLPRTRVVVSVNTGVMHLAAIVGAPTVSLNGPTNGARWGPVGPCVFGVQASGEDCGYLHLGFDFHRQATDCMERITVEQVVAAVHVVSAMPRKRV